MPVPVVPSVRRFVAGGGPGFTSNRDTVGRGAYTRINPLLPTTRATIEDGGNAKKNDPTKISSDELVMWLKADALVNHKDGQPVSHWKDSSGNGLDAAQSMDSRQPVLIANAINGKPALRFDGDDDHLKLDHYPGLFFPFHQSTLFVVVRPAGGGGGTVLSQAHANLTVTSGKGGSLVYSSSYPANDGTRAWPQIRSSQLETRPLSRGAICTLRHGGDQASQTALFINGTRDDNGVAFPYHVTSPIQAYIGCAYRERLPWKGDIAEIIFYARALKDEKRRSVEQFLSKKYTINLVRTRAPVIQNTRDRYRRIRRRQSIEPVVP